MKPLRILGLLLAISFFALGLHASAAPAATEAPQASENQPTLAPAAPAFTPQQPDGASPTNPALSVPTEAAAEAERPSPTQLPLATSPALPTPAPPILAPTAGIPTQTALPTPYTEQRVVEIEYPLRLRLGESDIIRIALIPYQDGYLVKPSFLNTRRSHKP